MEGYWKSDSLQFIGSQITYGWEPTLSAYKKRYPNADAMGKLSFDIMQIMSISADAYLITGKYRLDRDKDHPEGVFTLLFRKKDEKWVIVYDHTS